VLHITFREVQEAGGKEEDGGAGLRILLQQARLKQMTDGIRHHTTFAKVSANWVVRPTQQSFMSLGVESQICLNSEGALLWSFCHISVLFLA